MRSNDEKIRDKQTTIDCLENELRQTQQSLDELKKTDQNKINAYGTWMSECLKAIQSDQRFHKKPIGPIGKIFSKSLHLYYLFCWHRSLHSLY